MLCYFLSDRFIEKISCGSSHSIVLDREGFVYAAGNSDCGQLGVIWYNFNKRSCKFPFVQMPVFSDKKRAMQVEAGDGFSVILTKDHEVYSCGKGNFGRLGLGDCEEYSYPTKIEWFTEREIKVKNISAGGRHCLAIGVDKYH